MRWGAGATITERPRGSAGGRRTGARSVSERTALKERGPARRTLAGRYELREVIGRGGMGTVYRAQDRVLKRAVAVKTLPGLLAEEDPAAVARFEREARAAAALSHPAVVAVYDTGSDGATRFIVMELVRGRSLEATLRDQGPVDPERAVGIATSVAEALAAAHAAGIVHRDIKPANVMVTDEGAVKVLDFGIARALGASALTRGSAVLGTAAYMAPEQALGKPADERSDIYSLGCVLYALLVGHPPFRGEGPVAIMSQHANAVPRPPRAENPRISSALSALVVQMLAKAPAERPQSAGEVRERLFALSGAAEATAPTAPMRDGARTRALPGAERVLPGAAPPARRRMIAAGALLALVAAIVLAALLSGSGKPSRPVSSARGARKAAPGARRTAPATKAAAGGKRAPVRTTAVSTTTRSAHGRPLTRAAPATGGASASGTKAPSTIPAALHALTRLILDDVRSGTVAAPAARQIGAAIASALRSSATAGPASAEPQLTATQQQVVALEQQGEIAASAMGPLNQALANLAAVLPKASPATQAPAPAPASGPTHTPAPGPTRTPAPGTPAGHVPPGHGGVPPGQARHDGPGH